jgi:hypothetical protein
MPRRRQLRIGASGNAIRRAIVWSFWDSIVAAAGHIENFSNSIVAIRQDEVLYTKALAGAQHTFPPYYALVIMPDPMPVLSRYASIVRGGEADYNFASIWEQKKTAEVIDKRLAGVIGAVHSATARLSTLVKEVQTSGVELQAIHADTTKMREFIDKRSER